jgi:diguanylate cyclase (GGDEF)-like protein/PAS domain S-box-containing protein
MPLESHLLDEQKASVLAVDDTPAILQLLELALGIDYEIVAVDSGQRALDAFRQRQFDLVMLDLMMPDMDGFETLKRLKDLPSFEGTPVIFLTAMDDLASECNALELGADDYITKPFKPNLVRLRIANILHRVRLQRLLSLALAGADQGLWSWSLAGGVRIASAWSQPLSVDGHVKAIQFNEWQDVCHPDDALSVSEVSRDYLSGVRQAFEVDARLRRLGGEWAWFNIYGKFSGAEMIIGTYRNVEARKQAELRLRESEERLRHVMDATGEGIWDWAVQEPTVRHNAAWCRLFGLGEETANHPLAEVLAMIHPDDRAEVERLLHECLINNQPFSAEYRVRHIGGWDVWVQARGKVVERSADGSALRMVGALQDISEKKRIEEEYRRLALFDTLTGLPNRRLLNDRLTQAIEQSRRNAMLGGLMFIDMDRFKELNDTLGHDYGDMLLIEVARRLLGAVRKMDTAARLGGDEFVIMLPQLSGDAAIALKDAMTVANKVLYSLGESYRLDTHVHSSTPSIGLTLFSGDAGEDVESILRRADTAMYEAKRAGRNRICIDQVFTPGR